MNLLIALTIYCETMIFYGSCFRHEWTSALNEYRVEASWKLGKWENVESYLKNVGSFGFNNVFFFHILQVTNLIRLSVMAEWLLDRFR